MAESDGLDEAAEQMLRVALTAAAQLAERLAHARAQAAREVQARSDRDAQGHTARVEAEHRAARAQLNLTRDTPWWDTANGPDIADAYATARRVNLDPAVARDADRVTQQVQNRYGPAAVPNPAAPSPAAQPSPARRRPGDRAAQAQTTALAAADARAHIATRTHAWLAVHAHELPPPMTRADAAEAVSSRLRADLTQPRPATEATGPRAADQAAAATRPRTVNRFSTVDFERS